MLEELLDARRVCRRDLRSRSSSPSSEPDQETQDILQTRLAQLYGPITTVDSTNSFAQSELKSDRDDVPQEDNVEGEFEFRLFATSTGSKSASDSKAGRIILGNDDEDLNGNGGFVVPERDSQYFFTGELTAQQRREFELAAVSGEDIRRGLQVRHTGLEVPWRVSMIKLGASKRKITNFKDARVEDEMAGKRKRMGKKMRIKFRIKEKIRKELLLSEQEKLALKEAAQREKKTEKNRAKQRKKREKEKAKKAGNTGDAVSSPAQVDIVMGEG